MVYRANEKGNDKTAIPCKTEEDETDGRGRRRRARVSRIKKLDMSCSVLLFPPVINTRRLLHMDEKAGLGQDIDATERDESETGCREAKLID